MRTRGREGREIAVQELVGSGTRIGEVNRVNRGQPPVLQALRPSREVQGIWAYGRAAAAQPVTRSERTKRITFCSGISQGFNRAPLASR